jgi:hypothetical protein
MVYFVVYAIFAYLIVLGTILAEVMLNVKPNRWQLFFFLIAPAFLPLYVGYWMCQMVNMGQPQETVTQDSVKVKIVKP